MKKQFLLLIAMIVAVGANAQSRGIKIGYIDMEYILEKVPDYAEAKNQLELKAQKWKQEIEVKKNDVNKLRESLKTEKVLLTKELITEREEEIAGLEKELLDYQEKRFGPRGDLITQKAVLVKPIQDQVFTAVQDVAEQRKIDFVFDKSSDLTMLYSAKKYDISEYVIRKLNRSSNRQQLSGKEQKKLEEAEAKEDLADDPEYMEKNKAAEDRKAARKKVVADREAKRQENIAKREQQKQERLAKKNGTVTPANNTPAQPTGNQGDLDGEDEPSTTTTTNRPATNSANVRNQGKEPVQGDNAKKEKVTATDVPEEGTKESVDRQNAAQLTKEQKDAERKAALEARKQKILADREANKKAREEKKQKAKEERENKANGNKANDNNEENKNENN